MAEEYSSGATARRRRRRSKYLPEELQEKILLHLPVKSLIRFELVCKTWLSMFHSRRFIDLHGQHGHGHSDYTFELHSTSVANLRKMIPGLIDRRRNRIPERPNNKEYWAPVVLLLGPLNGIYCLTSHLHGRFADYYSILTGKIALCNPATRAYKFINPFPVEFHCLLSNISSEHAKIHFGFGNVNEKNNNSLDYRVLVLIHHGCTQYASFLVFVYSVQRGVWEKIVDYEPARKRNVGTRKATEAFDVPGRRILFISDTLEVCPQRFFQGCYYWLACIGGDHGSLTWDVLSFDFFDQSFKLIGGPPEYMDYLAATGEELHSRGEVFVLHDRLAIIHLFSVLSDNGVRRIVEVCVWMMMEYGVEKSWTKICAIKPNFNGDTDLCKLYGIHYQPQKSGGDGIGRLILKDGLTKHIISWDDAGNEVNSVFEPEFKVCWNTLGISTYVETLERL